MDLNIDSHFKLLTKTWRLVAIVSFQRGKAQLVLVHVLGARLGDGDCRRWHNCFAESSRLCSQLREYASSKARGDCYVPNQALLLFVRRSEGQE